MVFLLLPRESQVTADKVEWLAVEARVGNRNRPPHFNFRLEPAIFLFLTIGTQGIRSDATCSDVSPSYTQNVACICIFATFLE